MPTALKIPRQMWFNAFSRLLADRELNSGAVETIRIASTFLNVDGGGDITTRDVERAVEATGLERTYVIDTLHALDRLGWLWEIDNETYELTIPTHMWTRLGEEDGERLPEAPPQHVRPALPVPPVAVPTVRVTEPRCALYRWYDKRHNLLYIGVTNNPKARAISHAAKSRWWPLVARQDVEWFPSRAEAEVAERVAIREECPLFNQHYNDTPQARERLVDYLTACKRTDLLFDAAAT